MKIVEKYKEVNLKARDDAHPMILGESFGTVHELLDFMKENEIPMHAHIMYMGCGSHTVGLGWIKVVEEPEFFESPHNNFFESYDG